MKKTIKLPSLSRVSPGNVATLEMALGATYERIEFTVTAAAGLDAADIGRIRVMVNGRELQTYKNLQRLIDLNGFYNRVADSVAAAKMQFSLHFFRGELESNVMRAAPGLGTADLQTFHIEMEIDSAAPADIAITAHALVDPTPQPMGAVMRVQEFPTSSSVAGEVEIDKLPRGGWYSAVHFMKADISKVVNKANSIELVDATKDVLERIQKGATPTARVPMTAKATSVDYVTDGNLAQAVKTGGLQDWRYKLTLDTAGSFDVITETIDTL